MIFIYGAPTCGKTFAITELATEGDGKGREWSQPHFLSLEEIVETSRKLGLFYGDHLMLDTDWLFPTVIRDFTNVRTIQDAWEYWRSNHDPAIVQRVEKEFAALRIEKCLVFTNLAMWNYGVDVPLRYARTSEDIRSEVQARDALKGRRRKLPDWVKSYVPPKDSIILPTGVYIYPRIVKDLAEVSPAFSKSELTQQTKGAET
jgi:hypothetical protein